MSLVPLAEMPPGNEERPARRSKGWLAWGALAVLYTVLTLIYFWPLPLLWQDHLGPKLGDPLFNLYVLKWGVHQIRLGLPDLWNANLLYPAQGALAFSDHLLGPALQLTLFETLIPNAIAGYNFLFLSSFVASALATAWVLRRSGLSYLAAGLAGWMYAYSSFRLAQTPHLQILLAQWIPLTLWFWNRLLAERTWKNAALFLLFYGLNLSGGCYYAYMIHFPLAAIFAVRAREEGRALFSAVSLRRLLPVMLLAAAGLLLVFLPYLAVSREHHLVRPDSEVVRFGATLASYFSPSRENLYFGPEGRTLLRSMLQGPAAPLAKHFFRPENELFAGFLPTLLFAVGAVAAWRGRHEGARDPWVRGLVLSGLLCFALSFSFVYLPLMRVIPGLSGMRVPPRFYAFLSLTLVYFAGYGVDRLLAAVRRGRSGAAPRRRLAAVLAVLLAVGLAVELAPRRLPWMPVPREEDLPEVYRWIRDEPSVRALLELPLFADPRECRYLYASTVHWKPIANGYSGFVPALHDELAARIGFLPASPEIENLRQIGITHLVVHARAPGRDERREIWESRNATGPGRQVERVYQKDGDTVYRLVGAAGGPVD